MKIHFIYLGNKDIYCIFKTCCIISSLFRNCIFFCSNNALFSLNHALKFKYRPQCVKGKSMNFYKINFTACSSCYVFKSNQVTGFSTYVYCVEFKGIWMDSSHIAKNLALLMYPKKLKPWPFKYGLNPSCGSLKNASVQQFSIGDI